MKKRVREVLAFERSAECRHDPDSDVVLGYCAGVRSALTDTGTCGFSVALAALASVLAGPMDQVNPLMGAHMIITVFAIVVIGGMGSIMGSALIGFSLGLLEALTKVFLPQASNVTNRRCRNGNAGDEHPQMQRRHSRCISIPQLADGRSAKPSCTTAAVVCGERGAPPTMGLIA